MKLDKDTLLYIAAEFHRRNKEAENEAAGLLINMYRIQYARAMGRATAYLEAAQYCQLAADLAEPEQEGEV